MNAADRDDALRLARMLRDFGAIDEGDGPNPAYLHAASTIEHLVSENERMTREIAFGDEDDERKVAHLKETLGQVESLKARVKAQKNIFREEMVARERAEIGLATARRMLADVYALVNAECPSLLDGDSGGDNQLGIEISDFLNCHPQGITP